MKINVLRSHWAGLLSLCIGAVGRFAWGTASAAEPLRALLIAGGCCHDYGAQQKLITEGISARANVTWKIVFEKETSRAHEPRIYSNPDWAKGFDVVLHDECFGDVTNVTLLENIVRPHREGLPAVTVHCSTHSYRRSTSDEWRKLLGVSSYQHQPRRAFEVVPVQPNHPVLKGFPADWKNAPDELYEIVKVWPDCTPLAKSVTPGKDTDMHPAIWVNTFGKGRVFGTTLGHANETVSDPVYLDLLTRGLLWSCDKLDKDGKPKAGYEKK